MITTIATAIAQNVILGWLWRRAQELASLGGVLVPIYLAMPPSMQADVQAIFTGQGGGLSISAAIGLGYYLWTQWQSYQATVKPQVVTSSGEKIALRPNGATAKEVEQVAKLAPRQQTLAERLAGMFARH
jgi:hypothetical protein